ncbi:MAG: hypothetical protein AUG74_10250, partial [Bacteroidetes bacterium 13_1_20CM_4_60_6]
NPLAEKRGSGSFAEGEYMSIFIILFVVLLVAWLLGWGVLHVASGLIHILLIVAVISLILHFVRGAKHPA